jgi:hypothetical protein
MPAANKEKSARARDQPLSNGAPRHHLPQPSKLAAHTPEWLPLWSIPCDFRQPFALGILPKTALSFQQNILVGAPQHRLSLLLFWIMK